MAQPETGAIASLEPSAKWTTTLATSEAVRTTATNAGEPSVNPNPPTDSTVSGLGAASVPKLTAITWPTARSSDSSPSSSAVGKQAAAIAGRAAAGGPAGSLKAGT